MRLTRLTSYADAVIDHFDNLDSEANAASRKGYRHFLEGSVRVVF